MFQNIGDRTNKNTGAILVRVLGFHQGGNLAQRSSEQSLAVLCQPESRGLEIGNSCDYGTDDNYNCWNLEDLTLTLVLTCLSL